MIKLFSELIDFWNQKEISYSIIHGIEEYPLRLGRDIDVFVRKDQIVDLPRFTADFILGKGFFFLVPTYPYDSSVCLIITDFGELEVDFMDRIYYRTSLLADFTSQSEKYKNIPFDRWGRFSKRSIISLLAGSKKDPLIYKKDLDQVKNQSIKFLGQKITELLLTIFSQNDTTEIKKKVNRIKYLLFFHSLRSPFTASSIFANSVKNQFLKYVVMSTPIVSFSGPDGIGKSTTINLFKEKKPRFVTEYIVKNWRPHILPRLGRFIGKPTTVEGIGEKNIIVPRNKHGQFQLLRVVYYWLDFVLGHYVRDKVNSSKLKLIVYDRSIYDTLINPERFGLKNGFLTKLLVRYSPKPDILFYLSDFAEKIYDRKPELSINEIKRQQKKWIELFLIKNKTIDLVVEINNTPDVIAEYIKFIYLRFWKQKFYPDQFYTDYLTSNYSNALINHEPVPLHKLHILKFKDGRTYFIPNQSYKIYKNSLSLYEAHSSRGKFYKKILLLLFPLKNQNLALKKEGSDTAKFYYFVNDLVKEMCDEQFGDGLNFAVSLGAPGPFQKPVVKVIGASGNVFCYIKIGVNSKTNNAVKNEVKWLNELVNLQDKGIEIPKIIFKKENKNHFFFAQSSFEKENGYKTKYELDKYLRYFQLLNQRNIKSEKFNNSQLSLLIASRISQVSQEYLKNTLSGYFNRICNELNDREIQFALNHGDFTPWNCRFRNDGLFLFDWEYADDIHPVSWDLIRFLVQTSLHIQNTNLLDTCKKFKSGGAYFIEVKKYISLFGSVDDDLINSIIGLYLFEQVLNACYFDIDNVKKLSENLSMLYLYFNLIDELNL